MKGEELERFLHALAIEYAQESEHGYAQAASAPGWKAHDWVMRALQRAYELGAEHSTSFERTQLVGLATTLGLDSTDLTGIGQKVLDRIAEDSEEAQAELEGWQRRCESLQKDIDTAVCERDAVRGAVEAVKVELEDTQRARDSVTRELNKAQREVETLNTALKAETEIVAR